MAKHQAEFSCGHSEQVVLFGKSSERDRKLEWYKECGLCLACYAAQKEKERQEKTRIAEQHAQESGLRPLIGTEKQIAWAETIRQDRMSKVFALLKAVADRMPQLWPACDECIVWLRDQVSAKWWIDNRNEDLTGLLIESEQFRQLVMDRARGKHAVTAMSDIVQELARRNWSDAKIAKELGMDADEVLRLKQISGLAEMFADQEFSEAWETE